MLVLTEAAAEVVKSVTSTPQAPEATGLRIASAPDPGNSDWGNPNALQVTAVMGPGDDDQVVEAAGARVYLEPQAAAYLEDKVLDAQVDEQGNAHFTVAVQDPGQA
jgi:iron-sulfur cluster assembly protein